MAEIKWEKWEKETFERADAEGKPLFLWIEYPGCIACKRMEEESFSDAGIVEYLNNTYIPVKVSRDERPDVDRHFQRVFETMTGKNPGWPLSVFIDPEHTPLYVTAYVPIEARDGMMGLGDMLELIDTKYASDRDTLISKGKEVLAQLTPKQKIEATKIDIESLGKIFSKQAVEAYDEEHMGFGQAPKYLHPATLQSILSWCDQGNEMQYLHLVTRALDAMLDSPVWDSEDGAFFCCAHDEAWQIPKRDKSLAGNALMSMVLLQAGVMKSQERYIESAKRIGEWALSQMKDSNSGLFYSGTVDDVVDKRIFLAPNAMMTKALLKLAGKYDRFRPDALGSLNSLMEKMTSEFDLKHQLEADNEVTFLEDYSTLAETLISADDLTGNSHFSLSAAEIANAAIRRFYNNGFWGVADGDFDDPEAFVDNTLPSAAATMAMVLGELGRRVDRNYMKFAKQTFAVASYDLMRYPIRKSKMAEAALFYHDKEKTNI